MHLFYLQTHPFIDNSFVREFAFSAYRNLLPLISTDKSTKTFSFMQKILRFYLIFSGEGERIGERYAGWHPAEWTMLCRSEDRCHRVRQ